MSVDLPEPLWPTQGVHLAGADVEVDVVERLGAGERLREVRDLEDQPAGVRLCGWALVGRVWLLGPLRPHPAVAGRDGQRRAASSSVLVFGPRTWNSHRPTSGIGDSPRAEATPCRRALHSVAQIRGSATPLLGFLSRFLLRFSLFDLLSGRLRLCDTLLRK